MKKFFAMAAVVLGLSGFVGGRGFAAESAGPKTDFELKFDRPADEPEWVPQNDNVMGGISKGQAVIREGQLGFSGVISLENDGGFAQVRILNLDHNLSAKRGMRMRVMGDGRTYQFRLATEARYRGSRIAYRVEFPTREGEWSEVSVRFADLVPTHHGDTLDGPPADLSQVREMSFLLADGKAGPFSLIVDWMRTE